MKHKLKYTGSFDSTCDNCGQYTTCTWHHLVFGKNNKIHSDRYGLVKPLCIYCHTKIHHGKDGKELAEHYKAMGQMMFEETHSHEEFTAIFGVNYL